MSKLPRFSFDLVAELELDYPPLEFPKGSNEWMGMYQEAVRKWSWRAGQRSVIDDLIDRRENTNDEDQP